MCYKFHYPNAADFGHGAVVKMLKYNLYFFIHCDVRTKKYLCCTLLIYMSMEKEQKEKLHAVRIPCNSTVKNYTFATLKRLGLDEKPGKVYNDIVSGNGAVPKSVYAASTKAKTLLEMIPKFHPPVPVTAAEKQEYDALIEQWGTHIKTQINDAFSVIYLCNEVNKVLQKKNSTVRCQRKHLVWCLSLLGESAMTPKGVADAILRYDGTDWENLPQLENDDKYYVRLNDDSDEEKQKFLDTVEFIYALSSSAADASLVEKIQNDIDVLTEFSGWGDALTDYKYVERYKEFAGRLQTLPAALLKKFKVTKKQMKSAAPKKQEMTQEDEQCATTTGKEEVMESPANESTEQPSVDEETTDSSATVESPSVMEEHKQIDGVSAENDDIPQQTNEDIEGNDAQHEPEQCELNQMELTDYINEFTRNDETGRNKISEVQEYIDAFCKFKDFDAEFDDLKRSVDDYQKRFKGGYIAGIIKNKVMQHESNNEQQ